jgi:hypothetical protein
MRILLMAVKWGPNVLLCMPNRTKRILLVSLMDVDRVMGHSRGLHPRLALQA